MKKIVSMVLTAALLLGTAGCSGTAGTSSAPAAAAAGGSSAAESSEAAPSAASSAPASTVSGSISISGSSALYPLVKGAAAKFKADHPDASITLNAGGSGVGLKQVAAKSVDIGDSDVFADEKLPADQAKQLVDHQVCVITMAPIVSADVGEKVTNLTTDQLVEIFTGKTKSWKDVGGPDEPVTLVTRPTTSGTRSLFKQYALGGKEEAHNKSLETDDSGTLIQTVSQHKGAIGYVALSYLVNKSDVKTVAIDGVQPTLENTYSGKYKVWGYEHMYTNGEADGVAKALIDFMQTPDYGRQMEAQGYNVASKMQVQRKDPKAK